MIKLKSLLESRLPKKFFHTTKEEYLPSIMKNGLHPQKGGKEWIYLTENQYTAQNYGNMFDRGTKVVMLEIDPKQLDENLLGPDDDDLSDVLHQESDVRRWYEISWQESMKKISQVTYSGVVPPRAIKIKEKWKIKF